MTDYRDLKALTMDDKLMYIPIKIVKSTHQIEFIGRKV